METTGGTIPPNSTLPESTPGPGLAGPTPPLIGDRYRLLRLLGSGGFGQVWVAEDRLHGARVAVKLLPSLGEDAQFRARQELTALRRARLPGVVRLRDDGLDGGLYYLVMDLVEGRPFPGPLPSPCPWEALRPLAYALTQTLARLHFAGMVHLDLKPGNVLVDEAGRPVILDFGLARGQALSGWGVNTGATRRYASPEQLRGQPTGEVSDLYALGVMLYRAHFGVFPDEPLPPDAPDDAPPEVRALFTALLQPDPADRPSSAAAVLRALGEPPAPPFSLPGPRVTEDALQALFHGPDAFLHLREDAARELWRRTGGWTARVQAELGAWLRLGLAHWRDGAAELGRAPLDRLTAGLEVLPGEAVVEDARAAALLSAVHALAGEASPALLARAGLDTTPLEALEAQGLLWPLADGKLGAVAPAREAPDSRETLRRLSSLLPGGHPAKLRLLQYAGSGPEALLPELLDALDARIAEGRIADALSLAELGLALTRGGHTLPVLTRLCAAVLSEESRELTDRALYELGRERPEPRVAQLEALLRAARATREGEPERALEALDGLAPFAYEPLEIRRVAFGVRALRALRRDDEALDIPARWADSPERQGWLKTWQGNLRFSRNDFAEAARLHREAAALRPVGYGRAASLINAALALQELGALDEVRSLADEVLSWAREHRWPSMEAQAQWLQRHAAYRAGVLLPVEPALVDAAAPLGPGMETLFALNEAALAWRQGLREQALALADRAERTARVGANPRAALLAGSLRVHLSGDDAAVPELLRLARACPAPGIALQALALIAPLCEDPPSADDLARLVGALPPGARTLRRELLSPTEAIAGPMV